MISKTTSNRIRHAVLLLGALAAWGSSSPARGDAPPAAEAWQTAERITPEELTKILRDKSAEKPAIFHVGYRVLFAQARIPGSQFAGPGANAPGIEALLKAVKAFPGAKPIVLYCGCCPWEKCPNVEPAWRALRTAGFKNVKILYIAKNFGTEWVQKGYPVEKAGASGG
jgi:hypothetical protein